MQHLSKLQSHLLCRINFNKSYKKIIQLKFLFNCFNSRQNAKGNIDNRKGWTTDTSDITVLSEFWGLRNLNQILYRLAWRLLRYRCVLVLYTSVQASVPWLAVSVNKYTIDNWMGSLHDLKAPKNVVILFHRTLLLCQCSFSMRMFLFS